MEDAPQRTALVTGASSGIGLEIALELLQRGYMVYGVSHGAGETGSREELAAYLLDRRLVLLECDLTSEADLPGLLQEAGARLEDLRVVVLCAGKSCFGRFFETPCEEHLSVLALNLASVVRATHRMAPILEGKEGARMMYVSSTASLKPMVRQQAYHVSKSGLNAFYRSVYSDLRQMGIRATLVIPSAVATPFWTKGGFRAADRPPGSLDPRDVARQAVDALFKGRKYCVIGLKAKMQCGAFSSMPWFLTDLLVRFRGR